MRIGSLLGGAALAAAIVSFLHGELRRAEDLRALNASKLALEAEIADVRTAASAALKAVIRPEIIDAANRSVYLITDNGDPVAAAFVVDRERGLLATAAHTADSLRLDEPGAEIVVINQFSPRPMRVIRRKLHAGFGAFVDVVDDHQPIRKNSTLENPRVVAVEDLPFDVALIEVDAIDPETNENDLGPDLPIASDETLLAMRPGDPIAVIGFPDDRVSRDLTGADAASRSERGVVAAMIAPLDTAATARNPVINNLIVHRMATSGGNSGGPIINAEGKVVGLHSHGVKSRSSNADGVAQRSDMLRDLLNDGHDAARLSGVFIPAWRERLASWARAEDVIPWSLFAEHAGTEDLRDRRIDAVVGARKRPFSLGVQRLALERPAPNFMAPAPDVNGASGTKGFVIPEPGRYTYARFEVDPARDAVLFAFDYDLNNNRGYCPIDVYWREEGGDRLQVQRPKGPTQIVIRAKPNEVRPRIIHAAFRRAVSCGYKSDEIMVGQLAWGENDKFATDGPVGVKTAFASFGRVMASVSHFVECRRGDDGVFVGCERGDYIDLTSSPGARFADGPPVDGVGLIEAPRD